MINFSNPEKTAIIFKENKVSYADLSVKINQYAQLFKGKGYTKVALYCENRFEWVYAFYAGWLNNCSVITIDYLSSVDDVAYILNDSRPEVIFSSNLKEPDLNAALANLDYEYQFVNFDKVELPESTEPAEWNIPADVEQTAVIIYTSGTTGSPKGVMLSFNNLLVNLKGVTTDVKIFREDRQTLMLLPLHHILPLLGTMIAPLNVGATIVMSPSMQSSDLLETLRNNEVAIVIGVPRLYEVIYQGLRAKVFASAAGRIFYRVLSTFKSQSLSKKIFKKVHQGFGGRVEIMVSGGAALSPQVGKFFMTMGFTVLEGYGMTETAPMITFNRPKNFRIGSPGQLLDGVQCEIRDEEIVVKGPNVMQGYYNRPEETADIIKDGWLYTGDLGYFDKDGFLYITGRKKEIIVLSNGKNINPVEIEDKLEKGSPYISEAAVFLHQNQLHAAIIPDYNELSAADVKDVEEFFKETVFKEYNSKVSSYKRVMKFTIIKSDIPRTRLGKIQRFKLAELLEAPGKSKAKVADPDTEEYKTVKLFIESQTNEAISPDDHLEFDIALDSLGKLGLIDFIDKTFGIKIEEERLLSFPSVGKLVDFIRDNKLRHKVENIDWSAILKEKVSLNLPKAWFTQGLINKGSKLFFKLYFRFQGSGTENIPEGPCIIAPNHQSYFDALFVSSLIRNKTMKNIYFYAKKKHVNNGFLRFMARKNNVVVMDVNKDLKESIQKLAEILKMGRKVIIFPEGTRSKDGSLGEFKKTFAILSKELNVPVIPVAICGAHKALPTGTHFPRIFTKVRVQFLSPVEPANYDYDSLTVKVREQIASSIGTMAC
ncbi:MAG: AMP-binding protein [Salinivirgaceae bacterium]